MSLFERIEQRIFVYADLSAPPPPPSAEPGGAMPSDVPPERPEPVNVDAVLTRMAREKGIGEDWRRSFGALLRLLGVEADRDARSGLARELGIAGAEAPDDAALLDAVMRALADDGALVHLATP